MKLRFIALGLLTLAWIGTAQPIIRNQVTTNAFANGSNGQFLSLSGGVPVWAVPAGSAGTTNYFDTTIITNNFFISGKGNSLVITQGLTLLSLTANTVLKVAASGNIITNSGILDNGTVIQIPNTYSTFKVPDGAAAGPGLAFTLQSNVGLARLEDTTLSVVAGGSVIAGFGNGANGSYDGLKLAHLKATNDITTADLFASSSAAVNTLVVTQAATFAWTTLTMSGSNVSAISLSSGSLFKLRLTNDGFLVAPTGFPGTNFGGMFQVHIEQDSTGGRSLTATNGSWVISGSGTSTNAVLAVNTNSAAVSVLTFSTSPFTSTKVYGVLTPF